MIRHQFRNIIIFFFLFIILSVQSVGATAVTSGVKDNVIVTSILDTNDRPLMDINGYDLVSSNNLTIPQSYNDSFSFQDDSVLVHSSDKIVYMLPNGSLAVISQSPSLNTKIIPIQNQSLIYDLQTSREYDTLGLYDDNILFGGLPKSLLEGSDMMNLTQFNPYNQETTISELNLTDLFTISDLFSGVDRVNITQDGQEFYTYDDEVGDQIYYDGILMVELLVSRSLYVDGTTNEKNPPRSENLLCLQYNLRTHDYTVLELSTRYWGDFLEIDTGKQNDQGIPSFLISSSPDIYYYNSTENNFHNVEYPENNIQDSLYPLVNGQYPLVNGNYLIKDSNGVNFVLWDVLTGQANNITAFTLDDFGLNFTGNGPAASLFSYRFELMVLGSYYVYIGYYDYVTVLSTSDAPFIFPVLPLFLVFVILRKKQRK